MLQNIRNKIKNKFSDTVFGNASSGIKYLYKKNRKIFYVQIMILFLLSILLTGYGTLFVMNLGGNGYLVNLRNAIVAWMNKGIAISLVVYMVLELFFFRAVLLFETNFRKDEDRNYDVSNEGTYGTNNTMSEEDMKKTFDIGKIEDIKAPIFGKNPYNLSEVVGQKHPLLKINRNTLMVSGPSGGKSATYVIPLILQVIRSGQSAIVSDPKSELFKICSELAKMFGYEVRILNLNPMFLENSDPCNFMMYVGEDVDKAQVMSNAIIANTTGGEEFLDFWSDGALNLLQALILRINVGNDFKAGEKNLPMIFNYITNYTMEEMEADFATLPSTHPASVPFRIFADGEDKVKKQVLQGLRIKLKLFNSPKLRTILSATEGNIDIINPGRKRCLYFVGSNDQDSSMSPIVSLFYTLLYQELVRYADTRMNGELPVTVHMILDEFANMGTIPDFEKKLSTVRSRNIITHIIIQDINQLKTKYPNDAWRTVMDDIDYFMMLKTNDPETMAWWSKMSGEQTINVKNKRYERNKMDILGIHAQEQISEGQGTRQVFTEGEVRSLKEDEVLLLVSQHDMVKLKTFYWATDHPYGKYIKENQDKMYVLPAQHYPFWRLIRDGVVDKDFDYDHEPSFVIELPEDEEMQKEEDYDPDKILGLTSRSGSSLNRRTMNRKEAVKTYAKSLLCRNRRVDCLRVKLPVDMSGRTVGKEAGSLEEEQTAHSSPPKPELRVVQAKGQEKSESRETNRPNVDKNDSITSRQKVQQFLPVPDKEKMKNTYEKKETAKENIEEVTKKADIQKSGKGAEEMKPEENAVASFAFFENMQSLEDFLK